MRIILIGISLPLFILSACAPNEQPTEQPLIPNADDGSPTHLPVDLTPAARAAITALSRNWGLTTDQITLVSTEARDWPDGCLGVQEDGLVCTQVITPGFRVILEGDGKQVEYRTNEDGTQLRPASVALIWKREGGFAGFCDYMTVYLSGEVHRSSCKSGQYAEEYLIDLLSAEESAQMNKWVMIYGHVDIDASDPEGVSDRMIVLLTFSGMGSEQTVTTSDREKLLSFAQELYQRFTR
jgi:hypothetical protein